MTDDAASVQVREDEVDPKAHVFFLSYAHAPKLQVDQNKLFVDFFEDLSADVAQLVSLPTGSEPGYMDRSIGTGRRWTQELLRAIGTCQVFVALLSAGYFESVWCGQEWYAFSRRRVSGPPNCCNITPVVWAGPIFDRNVPGAISRVQWFMPTKFIDSDAAAFYEGEGIYGLYHMSKEHYRMVVWKLAQEIANIYYTCHAEPEVISERALRNPFKENRPRPA